MRQHHDIGGLPAGPIDRTEYDYAHWERRVDAMLRVLGRHGVLTVDELRRGIETLAPATYDSNGYYARWIRSVTKILIERGVLTRDEVDARVAKLRAVAEG